MPRPRYMETVTYPERSKPMIEEEDKDWHNVSLRKELNNEKDKLPKIRDDNRREKIHSEIGGK